MAKISAKWLSLIANKEDTIPSIFFIVLKIKHYKYILRPICLFQPQFF